MTPLRTHIAIASVALLGVVFFVMIVLHINPDILAIFGTVLLVAFAFWDVRFLLVGWFAVSPYFSPFGVEGEANIASNFSHNVIVPVIAVVILGLAFVRERRFTFRKEDLIWVAFIVYAVVSSVYATRGRYDDIRMLYLIYLIPFLLYLVVRQIEIDTRLFKMFAMVCIFHMTVFSLMCVYEYVTGEILYHAILDWGDVGSTHRFAGTFGTPIILGIFIPVVFLYIYLAFRFNLLPRYVVWISAVLSAIMIVLTFTRSVWLGAFLAFVYIVYKTSEGGPAKIFRLGVFVSAVVALVAIVTVASPAVQERLGGTANANFRVVMAEASMRMIADKPVVGWGTGTFDEVSDRYLFDALGVYIVKDTSHVTLLTVLAELGLLGTSLYLLFFYFNFRHKGVRFHDLPGEDQLIVAVNVGGAITFIVNAFLIDMRFYSIAYSWFFVNLGFILAMYRDYSRSRGIAV